MKDFRLYTTGKDWIYIALIGGLFGFLISLLFYFLNPKFDHPTTLIFGAMTALVISFFSSIFIGVSNTYILPYIRKKWWYSVSFFFSFFSGVLGFLFTFSFFFVFDAYITKVIEPYSVTLTISIGLLTILIGLLLHEYISIKYKQEANEKELLELKINALEKELNPHFLFNALNSVSELIYQNPKKAEESVLHLSSFLRNAIKNATKIPLEEELSMVKTYTMIENIRFNDHIHLHIDMDTQTSSIVLPKFSIQLLVENAIKHGYNNRILNIYIAITSRSIRVYNDGKPPKNVRFGTGLNNLKKRLILLQTGELYFEKKEPYTTFLIQLKEEKG